MTQGRSDLEVNSQGAVGVSEDLVRASKADVRAEDISHFRLKHAHSRREGEDEAWGQLSLADAHKQLLILSQFL